jgi:3-deoxy-D-manno-octulosonate 8-phosphate phosphatase KdsC-like HAD superfamily phosphatase
MKAKDETANSYVMLEGIALYFGVQTATVKKRAADLGIELFKVRKASSKNAYCAAVTAEDARRIAETFHAGNLVNNARVLGPDEISKLMEEK